MKIFMNFIKKSLVRGKKRDKIGALGEIKALKEIEISRKIRALSQLILNLFARSWLLVNLFCFLIELITRLI